MVHLAGFYSSILDRIHWDGHPEVIENDWLKNLGKKRGTAYVPATRERFRVRCFWYCHLSLSFPLYWPMVVFANWVEDWSGRDHQKLMVSFDQVVWDIAVYCWGLRLTSSTVISGLVGAPSVWSGMSVCMSPISGALGDPKRLKFSMGGNWTWQMSWAQNQLPWRSLEITLLSNHGI